MSEIPKVVMTQEEVRELVRTTVSETLVKLGVDISEPIEIQHDFQFVRNWRKSTETVKNKALVLVIGTIVAGFLGALWLGLKTMLTR